MSSFYYRFNQEAAFFVCLLFIQTYAPSSINPYFSAIPDTIPINGSEKLVTMITQAPTTGSSVSAAFASSGKTANAPSTNRNPEIVSAGMCLASFVIVLVRNIADTIATSRSPASSRSGGYRRGSRASLGNNQERPGTEQQGIIPGRACGFQRRRGSGLAARRVRGDGGRGQRLLGHGQMRSFAGHL